MKVKTGHTITITAKLKPEHQLTIGKTYLIEDMFDGLVIITDDNDDPLEIDENHLKFICE